jgi:hypothetical protein
MEESRPNRVKNVNFTISFKQALWSTQPPIQWVLQALSLEIKRQGRETDHSLPTNAKGKKTWIYTFTSPTLSWDSA